MSRTPAKDGRRRRRERPLPGRALGTNLTEADLSFPRRKPNSLAVAAVYRLQPGIERVVGRTRRLTWLLNMEKLFWRLAYEAAGSVYRDSFQNHALAARAETLARWLPEDARVLDFGCGHGRAARVIAPMVREVVGVDVEASKIELARAQNACSNVRFEVGDARVKLSERFDVVMLLHVIEHVDDPVRLLAEIAGAVPRVVVEVPLFHRDPLNAVRLDVGTDFSSDADHVREYTRGLLVDHLERAGWTIVDWSRGAISIAALAERRAGPPPPPARGSRLLASMGSSRLTPVRTLPSRGLWWAAEHASRLGERHDMGWLVYHPLQTLSYHRAATPTRRRWPGRCARSCPMRVAGSTSARAVGRSRPRSQGAARTWRCASRHWPAGCWRGARACRARAST